jgi:hypothetical protein
MIKQEAGKVRVWLTEPPMTVMLALARVTSSTHLESPTWLRCALLRRALTLGMWLCGCTALMPSATGHPKTGWDRGQGEAKDPGV